MLFVYILKCSDESYYTGVTNNLELRVLQHNNSDKETAYCFSRRPVKLVYFEVFQFAKAAIAREKQIKRWTRAKKEALMAQNYDRL